ncbi:hypothetical protein [Lysobacter sp. CA199]|uniref:hypothetical protein n=1 Tax=Lysobacter sp. CA199 TaxID=3455608 RepID=UPI003F8D7A6F
MDDRNLYAPPASQVVDAPGPVDRSREFYVVSARKFCLLFFFTFSLYQLYWFYAHWSRYGNAHRLNLWPVPRSLFSLLFAHSLANRIDGSLRVADRRFDWTPALPATVYVIAQLISNVIDYLPWPEASTAYVDAITLSMILPTGLALLRIQRAANAACGDPQGESNHRLTPANYVWLAIGVVVWGLIVLGLALPALPEG